MYRVWIEDILGFKLRGDQLTIDPVLPHDWHAFSIRFRYRTALYAIAVENPDAVGCGVLWVEVDGTRKTLETGDSFFVAPDLVHGAVALEPGILVDVFTPARQDFLK